MYKVISEMGQLIFLGADSVCLLWGKEFSAYLTFSKSFLPRR